MKTATSFVAAGFGVLLVATSPFAAANPAVSTNSENSVRIRAARVVKAPGGGSYVIGLARTSFGYSAPRAPHVHISAYDAGGKLLAEKDDKLDSSRLVRHHRNPRPGDSYVVFLPWDPSQIARIVVSEHSGFAHRTS